MANSSIRWWAPAALLAAMAGCGSRSTSPPVPSPRAQVARDQAARDTVDPPPTPAERGSATEVPQPVPPAAGSDSGPTPTPQPNPQPTPTRRRSLPWSSKEIEDPQQIERRLLEDAKYLASDELQGRGINTKGIELAAEHIARRYREAGLRTELFRGTPYHLFNFGARTVAEDLELELIVDGRRTKLAADQFSLFRRGRTGGFELPLVFVGYGITAPDAGYDDYAEVDVRGKAVLMLRHEPRQDDEATRLPRDRGDDKPSSHAYLDTKVANAMAHGAEAVLLCTDSVELQRGAAEARGGSAELAADRLLRFNPRRGKEEEPPAFHCRRSVGERLLQSAGKSLAAVERAIDADFSPQSLSLDGVTVRGQLSIRRRGRQLKNVVAELPGQGPLSEETIVVAVHYDHLGMGGAGSLARWTLTVHNGADDNASGTAAMLEVARQLAARGPLRRRVLFIAFSAEESGLVGSERYVRTPYVPLDQTVAMLNLDMVGRLGRHLEVHGVGTAKEFRPLLAQWAPRHQLPVRPYADGYGPSDHASFHERGVPVLHFFTGLHRDYHRPSDDYDKLNLPGMRRITLLTTDIAAAIAAADEAPERTSSGSDWLGLDDLDLSGPGASASSPRLKLGARVVNTEGQVELKTVGEGTPAWKAGLRSGDLLLRCDDEPVRDVREFVQRIRETKGGTKITLRVRRGEAELELQVTLGDGA